MNKIFTFCRRLKIEKNYYENGSIKCKKYLLNNQFHNEDGPAIIWYYNDGNIKCKEYWINSKIHNENGPAYIEYYNDGNIQYEEYYLNGIQITDELQIMVIEGSR